MYGSDAMVDISLSTSVAETWSANVRTWNFELSVSESIEV